MLQPNGLPAFAHIRPEHIEPAVLETIEASRAELEQLIETASQSGPDFDAVILPLEALGDRLHRVWSPVRHLQSVANAPELRAAYDACLPALSRHATELGHNQRLYQLYQRLSTDRAAHRNGVREGGARLLELAIRDFMLAGVHLPEEQKARFKAIMEELAQTEAVFEHNVLDSAAAWSLHISDPARLKGVPAHVLEAAAEHAREAGKDGWILQLDQPTYVDVVTHADNRELRQQIYRAWVTRASDQADYSPDQDNSTVMERILALRHEAAQIVGYADFADYSLATKMAKSADEVRAFLVDLVAHSRAAAQRELAELEAFAGLALEPWDIAWYSEKLRHRKYAISDEELRPFFPLPRVMSGLFGVLEKLYGLRISQVEGIETWDQNAAYYQLSGADGRPVGGFYVDFYARSTKRAGAWMDQCLNRSRDDGQVQIPVAHLVCNYSRPSADRPSLLTHDEVVTLFHEMGHVLHHLLTRIDYPSVSGINGVPWDAVELPSQFMETFAWEPEVVALCSAHYQTGEPLPATILKSLRESKNFQAGLDLVRQVEFALFDMRIHSGPEPADSARIAEILREVRTEVAVIRYPEWNRLAHAFTHIFGGGYAAGYYSYKWAEVLAADAFAAFEEGGLFNAELAQRFRQNILEIGGSRDIAEAFIAFRGRPAHVDALLKQTGITA
ncbi:MAG: M3 family metallopeptidase [Chromatiales bacterium]|nr:M3 family metallopeptidase [Chromatiales bacterium]